MVEKNSMKHFYSHLNMEDITDADYAHAKSVKTFWNKKFRRISWFAYSKWEIIVISRYISEL